MKASAVAAALVGAFIFGNAPAIVAEAHAEVSAQCWQHLAEHPGTTPAADRRFHLERGEFSPCTEADANGGQSRSNNNGTGDPRTRRDSSGDESKSRYCRTHWFC